MEPFESLGDLFCLQIASEIRSDLIFDISNLNYLYMRVHIAYMFWTHFDGLLVASEAFTASKEPGRSVLTSDLEFIAQTSYATMFVWTV